MPRIPWVHQTVVSDNVPAKKRERIEAERESVEASDEPDGAPQTAPLPRPRVNDSKETWEAWAVAQHGLTGDQAAAKTKAELVKLT